MNNNIDTEKPLRILHLEDSPPDAEIIRERLIDAGFSMQIDWATNEKEFSSFLQCGGYDIILADYLLPSFDAPGALQLTKSLCPGIPFICVSGAIGEEKAVELLKRGATDYVLKDRLDKLPIAMKRALDEVREQKARQLAEEALHRLNRELRAISNCNQVLVRAEDEQTLLNEICRIICDEAGYRMAWVGYAVNDEVKTVCPVAWAGVEDEYLTKANITWADTERGRGPTGTAVRSGEIVYIMDYATDPIVAPWRENALQRGYHCSIALPLKDEDANVFGVLTIYSKEINAFIPDEIRLMEELADDLAFGIMTLRTRMEHKQAEKALQESEQSYRTLVDLGHALVWAAGIDKLCNYFNRVWLEYTGRTLEQEMGNGWAEGVHPDDLQRCLDIYVAAFGRREKFSMEYRLRRYDGEYGWILDDGCPRYDSKGEFSGYIGHCLDITERKQAEEALEKQYSTLCSIIDSTNALVFSVDQHYRYTSFNQGHAAVMKALYGVEIEHSQSILDYMTVPEDRETAKSNLDRALAGEQIVEEAYSGEEHHTRQYFQVSHSPIKIEEEIIGVAVLAYDLTERKRAEEALYESQQVFRILVENSPDIIARYNRNCVRTYVNPVYIEVAQISQQELLSASPIQRSPLPAVSATVLQNLLRRVLDTGVIEAVDVIWPKADHIDYWYNIYAYPEFDRKGQVVSVMTISRDITERKLVDEREREFYRSTILAATGGKLLLTEREEIERIAGPLMAVFQIASADDFHDIRKTIVDITRSSGMDELRASDYCVAVGEAVTNAIKHAGGGSVSIHNLSGALLSIVSDQGPGIETKAIPEVALVKGYTTAGTLGMGYKIILTVADKLYLATGPGGTTVGIEMNLLLVETIPNLGVFSSNW